MWSAIAWSAILHTAHLTILVIKLHSSLSILHCRSLVDAWRVCRFDLVGFLTKSNHGVLGQGTSEVHPSFVLAQQIFWGTPAEACLLNGDSVGRCTILHPPYIYGILPCLAWPYLPTDYSIMLVRATHGHSC